MNRKHVNAEMDSGLGSDEDRRGRTKEQKQLHNQQLLSGCFIDAATLLDEPETEEHQRRNEERRQGALIFQSSIPNFSMLQMSSSTEENGEFGPPSSVPNFPETSTPFNSIVHLDLDERELVRNKSPLGFYVDLSSVPDVPETPPSTSNNSKKNIFSMVIDFEGPKKDKPTKLSSSFVSHKRSKPKSNLIGKLNGSSGSLSSSVSSINSTCMASTSRQSEEHEPKESEEDDNLESKIEPKLKSNKNSNIVNIEVLSASLVKNLSISSKSSDSSSFSDKNVVEKNEDEQLIEEDVLFDDPRNPSEDNNSSEKDETERNKVEEVEIKVEIQQQQTCPQFVKLSDLECQKPRVELNFTPRMSRSIPESHWVESPFLMSRSACYRSAPHPMEPETASETNSDTESILTNSSVSQPKKSVRRLGTDLLRMFLEEIGPDVVVEVDGHKLKAHKCILASRCQYFAALLSGNWLEKSGNIISMQGFSYESVYFSLCHIYSGAAHVPDSISLVELASLADMLGLEGLKEVVEHALKQRHCHNFHKPCAGCCTGVLEVLPLSAAYGLDDLYQRCLQWITQHFVRVWPSRAFASLPRELREKCYQQHVVHMCPDKVLETILACDKVLATLPALRWAEPVTQLVLQLTDACHLYHRQHFAAVLGSATFLALDTGLGFGVCQVEDQMISAAKNLGVDQACRSYTRCCKMLDQHWSRPFADLLNKLKHQLEQCLVGQADRLIRSNAWLRLDTALRSRIKELTPTIESQSRLPRATPLKNRKPFTAGKTQTQSPLISSSDSSRNSSPGMNQQGRLHNTGGSPSLRRSLLLAAKSPQVPPSPSTHRRSTLTQPTAASAAKSAPSKNVRNNQPAPRVPPKSTTPARPSPQTQSRPSSSKKSSAAVSRNTSLGKKDAPGNLTYRRPDSRSSSPMKSESRTSSPRKLDKSDSRTSSPRKLDSRVTSPIKGGNMRSPSPLKSEGRCASPRKATRVKTEGQSKAAPVSAMTRSGTFLKEEPTILGKVI